MFGGHKSVASPKKKIKMKDKKMKEINYAFSSTTNLAGTPGLKKC